MDKFKNQIFPDDNIIDVTDYNAHEECQYTISLTGSESEANRIQHDHPEKKMGTMDDDGGAIKTSKPSGPVGIPMSRY